MSCLLTISDLSYHAIGYTPKPPLYSTFVSFIVRCFISSYVVEDCPEVESVVAWGYTDEGAQGYFCKSDVINVALEGLCPSSPV